jgi:glycosyltransferase involved in cell wall biosynthesis
MDRIPKRVALVYDRVNKWGGAERVMLALHELFPTAPLYTSVYEHSRAAWAEVFPRVVTSFLQHVPFASSHHEFFPYLTPLAFESFDFSQYQAVISVTSADAKSIITQPGTFHLCYCLTPTRYLWSHREEYKRQLGGVLEFVSRPSFKYLKYWDKIAAARPDYYVSISHTVKDRIQKYYGIESDVVYPPVDVNRFSGKTTPNQFKDYFLYVGRMVPYKRADVVVKAFNRTKLPLVVVGSGNLSWDAGTYESELMRTAGPNIHFLGHVSETELVSLYKNCRAFIFFHEEDFGIVPVEAQAAGKPVIGLNRGGLTETVINGQTGILLDSDSDQALAGAVTNFRPEKFVSAAIKKHAEKFSLERFNQEFVKVLSSKWREYNHIYSS